MFNGTTTFILGAGASQELNLPIGSGLATAIGQNLTIARLNPQYFKNHSIAAAVLNYASTTGRKTDPATLWSLALLGQKISNNMSIAPSIDNYLNTHHSNPDIVAIGKIAIARSIISAEKESFLYSRYENDYYLPADNPKLLDSWHIQLWKTLVAGVEREQVDKIFINCRFIVFNYDRCLEHFLYLSLQQYFEISSLEAGAIMKTANIVHAYGKVGGLPWETDPVKTPYGQVADAELHRIASEIRTFTETVDEGVQADLRAMVKNTESIVFLGFGFIEQNMKLIEPLKSNAKRVFMTAYEMPLSEQNMAMQKISRILKRQFVEGFSGYVGQDNFQGHVVYGDCRTLMAHHRLRLPESAPM